MLVKRSKDKVNTNVKVNEVKVSLKIQVKSKTNV